jgi:cytochrome c553
MLPKTVIVRLRGAVAMKYISMIALSIAAAMLPAFAEDTVPYAFRRPTVGETYVPTLGDIMGATQLRHFKLWYAGKLRNWELATYELGQIEDSFVNAARLYQNIPIEKINTIDQPLMALASAIKAKGRARFGSAFANLTAACNGCHEAAHVGFVAIRVPTASPFSNQSFMPNKVR